MLTPTHLLTAQTAYLGACLAFAHPPAPAEAAVALAAALIPDLDSRQSYAGRLLPPLSGWLERQVGHRTVTHSLLAQALAGALAWALLPFGYFLALVAGWVSHTLADMMTPAGVAWLWSARGRCVLPGNPRYRMETMGRGELGFLIVMALVGLALMPLARTGEGTTGLIRSAIGDVAAARAEYDAGKGSHAFTLEVRGRDNRSYADIAGRYPVIGPFGEAGFLLASEDGPRSLCRAGGCDWYAEHAVLVRGAPELTTTFALSAPQTTAAALAEALEPLASAGPVYLLGTLAAPGLRAGKSGAGAPAGHWPPRSICVPGDVCRRAKVGRAPLARRKCPEVTSLGVNRLGMGNSSAPVAPARRGRLKICAERRLKDRSTRHRGTEGPGDGSRSRRIANPVPRVWSRALARRRSHARAIRARICYFGGGTCPERPSELGGYATRSHHA